MKKHLSKILGVILVLVAVIGVCLNPSAIKFLKNATGSSSITYYQTVESNVKTRTGPGEKYDKNVITIPKKGTVLKVIGSTKNSSGNTWYKLNNNYWVYSKRVTKHSHSYLGGYCTANQCGYEYPLKYESSSMTIRVKNSSGCKAWTRPYQDNSKNPVTYAYGKELKVVQKTTNQAGNLWFKVDSGYWVYSGNVEQIHTVKYDANGGSGAPGAQKFVSGGSMTISSTKPTRKGYDFKGWSTSSSSSSVSYTPGSKYSEKKSRTLYAVWASCNHNYYGGICKKCGYEYPLSVSSYSGTFTVTNPDGAKIWSRPYSENSNSPYKSPSGTNLTVVGKVTNVNESGKPKNLWYKLSNGYWVFSGNVAQRYTITYNANGGSGAPGAQYCLDGQSITIPSTKLTKTGYSFKGWSTSAYASPATYTPGNKYSFKNNVTLYAVWGPCSHPSYNGGICTNCNYEYPLSVSYYSAEFTVTNPEGAKIWSRPYSNKSKYITTYSKGTSIKVVAKVTNINSTGKPDNVWYKLENENWVYSGNVGQRYTIYFNANGGSGAPSAQNCVSGQSVTLSKTKPSKVGYTFQGWSTSSGSSKVTYKAGSKYSFKSNTTLYAVWEKCKHPSYSGGICKTCKYEYPLKETAYNGTFRVSKESGAPVWSRPYQDNSKKVDTYNYNKEFKVVAKVTNINSSGKSGNLWYKISEGKWIYSGNITQLYTVTYNANGGSGAPGAQKFLSGKTVTLSKTKPTKVGYIFKGWATSSGSSKVSYDPGDKYSKEKSLTLYAVWGKCSHKSYDSNGICKTCKYKYPIKVDAFKGLYIVAYDSGAKIRSAPYDSKENIIRTAKKNTSLTVVGKATNAHKNLWYKLIDGNWVYSENVEKGYTVTYNANGGTGAPAASGFISGRLVVTNKIPTRAEYRFMGWATSAGAKKASYNAGDTYNVKKDITLYAVWKKCSHSYSSSTGVCKYCKSDAPLTVTSIAETIYTVNNKKGVQTYKTPYEYKKAAKLTNNTPVLVVGKAKNLNGKIWWYKLNDGTWVKESEIKKRVSFTRIGDIPVTHPTKASYPGCFTILQNGKIGACNASGKWYYSFSYTKSKTTYTIYVSIAAFTGTSKNTQHTTVNKAMNDALNAPKGRLSLNNKPFIYHQKIEGEEHLRDQNGMPNKENITRPGVSWTLNLFEASAGINTSEVLYALCKYKGNVSLSYCPYLYYNTLEYQGVKSPQTSAEYVKCLRRGTASVNLKPEISVSVEPGESKGKYTGYLTNCIVTGKGYAPQKLDLGKFINILSCASKIGTSVAAIQANPKAAPKQILNIIKNGWSIATTVSGYTKSANYTSEKKEDAEPKNISYFDADTNYYYYAYSTTLKSPIALQSNNDYIKLTVKTNNLKDDQKVTVKIDV